MIQGPTPVEAMRDALGPVWSLAPPGPDNLLQHPAFLGLKAYCEKAYPAARAGTGFTFALSDALRAPGLPSGVRSPAAQRPVTIDEAAARLVGALELTTSTQRHLCPESHERTILRAKYRNGRADASQDAGWPWPIGKSPDRL